MALWNKITQYGTALRGRRIFAAVAIIAVVGVVVAAQGFSGAAARDAWHRRQSATDPIETARRALQRGSPHGSTCSGSAMSSASNFVRSSIIMKRLFESWSLIGID